MAEIGNYLDGDVEQEVRAQLEHHLEHCQTCTVLVDSTRKTIQIMTDTCTFELPETTFRPIAEKIMDRIRESQE
jgi:hypothetical protein